MESAIPQRLGAVAASWLLAASCGARPGAVHSETGLQGIQVAEGSLAGSWAQVAEFATLVPVPLLGEREGGFRIQELVRASWDAGRKAYLEEVRRCARDSFEIAGWRSIVQPETVQRLALLSHLSEADPQKGLYTSHEVIELWGVRDLPDPAATPLPTKDDFQQEPQSGWLWDEDEDGKPGVTVLLRGSVAGQVYVCERTLFRLDGVVLSKDRVQGLVRMSRNESNTVDSTVGWLKGETVSKQNPEGLRSWFDRARLTEQATCADVTRAVADGRLASARPF
ncbi:MAG: hypothetical protein HYZ28_27525 [Myxococcales bacterium]|nr:hypothetical protein [Myxococcales bacterium]